VAVSDYAFSEDAAGNAAEVHVRKSGEIEPVAAGPAKRWTNAGDPAHLVVHHHSGVERFFVADGQQCLERSDRTHVMNKGDTLVVPSGIAMRLVATGPTPRRALAAIVYDASQPPTTRMEGEAEPKLMSCK
jgi:mannose-6-phosphate isomerase-like protein (cupin superfamily)